MNTSKEVYFENELDEIMLGVGKIHKVLSDKKEVKEVFEMTEEKECDRGEGDHGDEKDLKAFLAEIEKTDAILKLKVAEEREAKQCRLQIEEESRLILGNAAHYNVPKAVKVNMEEFLKLLNETEDTDSNKGVLVEKKEKTSVEKNESDERTKCQTQQPSNKDSKFIERNIELAKCGNGVLSLTDQEKSRVKELLVDIEGTEEALQKVPDEIKRNVYVLDEESKSTLNRIDEQLETFMEIKNLESSQRQFDWINKGTEAKKSKENLKNELFNDKISKEKEKFARNRLKEINKLLNSMMSASDEEICPLSQEEIENLIQEAKQSLKSCTRGTSVIGHEKSDPETTPEDSDPAKFSKSASNEDTFRELVSDAKTLMPKFKFRFDDSC